MSDSDALIPYPHNQEIILRHRDSVVVYDPASKQLVSRNENKLDLAECPLCHRPFHGESSGGQDAGESGAAGQVSAPFASPEYFRMLSHSLPPSEQQSRASSPRRRLMHRLRSEGTESLERAPPPGSEFVASAPAPNQHGISASAFTPNYFNRFFVEERELGRGGKGVVLLVKHVLDGVSLGHFALKRIPVGDDHKWLEKVLVEVQLLQHLSHQNLVSYRHVWLEDVQISNFGPSVPCAFVLQQYCNMGDLHDYVLRGMKTETTKEKLKQRARRRSKIDADQPENLGPRRLQFEEIRSFFRDITAGLNHLHHNNYVHRDLKPSNCLLHQTGNQIRVLVSDFGEVQTESQMRSNTGATGTISYCAPEVLQQDPVTGVFANFTTKSDIFSLGMILYFLCFARLPYRHADVLNEDSEDIDLLRAEIRNWAGLESDREMYSDPMGKLYRFLRRLLSLDPNERPSAEETLHLIRTGGTLDDSGDTRTRSGSQIFDGTRRLSRISPIDTPSASTPARMPSPGMRRNSRSDAPEPLHAKSLRRNFEKELQQYEQQNPGNETIPSPTNSLVLHSGRTSPVKTPQPPEMLRIEAPRRRVNEINNRQAIKLAGLVMKLVSIYLPCVPVATEPSIGLFLLGMATFDLVFDFGIASSIALLIAHLSLLFGALHKDMLCVAKGIVWDDEI